MSVHRTVENVYIRQEAVQYTRHNFWRLLGMTVIIRCIIEVLSWSLTFLGDWLMIPEITDVLDQYARLTTSVRITSSEPLLNAMNKLFTSPKFILFNLVFIGLTGIVSAGLDLGYTRQLLDTGRGGYPEPLRIFRGMKLCLKAFGLQLWTGLKVSLWCLPGFALLIVGVELKLYDMVDIGNAVMIISAILMLIMSVRATLRYRMAPFLLADEPDRGIRDCVKFSTALMKGRLWQFMKVGIPAILKSFVAMRLADLAYRLIGSIVYMDMQFSDLVWNILIFAATVYFVLQLDMVYAVFYLRTRRPVTLEGEPKPVSYWLREHTETDIAPDKPENEAETEASPENYQETHDSDPEVRP